MNAKTVLISGGGIAGLTLAYWLKEYGFQPTIIERSSQPRSAGYKIDIRGKAVDVIKAMNLFEAVQAKHTQMDHVQFLNPQGKAVATLDADFFGGRANNDLEIMRGDLVDILYHAVGHTIEYIFDDTITAISQNTNNVEVTFDRHATRTFDLVVGADGIHSRVRHLVFGEESQWLEYFDHYIAICSIPNLVKLDHNEMIYAVPKKTLNLYAVNPEAEAKALFLFAQPGLKYDYRDQAQQKQIVAQNFASLSWQIPQILTAMQASTDFYFDALCQVKMPQWSKQNVVLVGDAGYAASAASGQGTSLALVGAYVLANALAKAQNPHQAFAEYESQMREFVAQNQALAPQNLKGMVAGSRFQAWFQLQMMRMLPHLPSKEKIVGRIHEAIQQAANAIDLPKHALTSASSQ